MKVRVNVNIDTGFYRDLTTALINALGEYYETMESQLGTLKAEERKKILSEIKNRLMDEAGKMAEWDVAIDDHTAKYDMLFRNFFRYSFVVLLALLVESSLRNLCYAVKDVKKSSRPVPNPRGGILKEYKKYLGKESVSVSESLWEPIHNLSTVRNCIVHASGKVKGFDKEKDLRRIAEQGMGVQISDVHSKAELYPLYLENDMLVLETTYCRTMVAYVAQLFEKLCDSVPLYKIDWSSMVRSGSK